MSISPAMDCLLLVSHHQSLRLPIHTRSETLSALHGTTRSQQSLPTALPKSIISYDTMASRPSARGSGSGSGRGNNNQHPPPPPLPDLSSDPVTIFTGEGENIDLDFNPRGFTRDQNFPDIVPSYRYEGQQPPLRGPPTGTFGFDSLPLPPPIYQTIAEAGGGLPAPRPNLGGYGGFGYAPGQGPALPLPDNGFGPNHPQNHYGFGPITASPGQHQGYLGRNGAPVPAPTLPPLAPPNTAVNTPLRRPSGQIPGPGLNLARSREARIYDSPYPSTPDNEIEPLIRAALAQVSTASRGQDEGESRRDYLRRLRSNIGSARRKREVRGGGPEKKVAKANNNSSDDGEFEEYDPAEWDAAANANTPAPPIALPPIDPALGPEVTNAILQARINDLQYEVQRLSIRANQTNGIMQAMNIPEGELVFNTRSQRFHPRFQGAVIGGQGVYWPGDTLTQEELEQLVRQGNEAKDRRYPFPGAP